MSKFFHWTWLVVSILLVLTGVAAALNPVETLLSILWVIGLILIVNAVYSFITYAQVRKMDFKAGWVLMDGSVTALLGILLLFRGWTSAVILIYIFSIWIVISGIIKIVQAFDFKKMDLSWGWLFGVGIVSVLFGILALFQPIIAAVTISVIIGLFLIIYGVVSIVSWWFVHQSGTY